MRNIVRFTLMLLAPLVLTGCPHDVNLTVLNSAPVPLEAQVTVRTPVGVQSQQIALGTVQPNAKATQQFTISDNDQYVVTANVIGSATVFSEARTVTSTQPKTIDASVTLAIQGRFLDPNAMQKTIAKAFENLGPDVGFNPVPVVSALQTFFGGLLVIAPPTGQGSDYQVTFQLTPDQFGSLVITPDHFQWPGSNSSDNADVDSEVTAKVGASVPLFSQLAANFSSSNVYNVQWTLNDYGMVPKPEAANWTYQGALSNLTGPVKQQLCNALKPPSSFAIYINKFYVIQNASFSVKQASKIDLGGSLAGGIVTASGAWSYANSASTLQQFQTSVLNIDGVRWQAGDIACSEAPAPAPAGDMAAVVVGPVSPPSTVMNIRVVNQPTDVFHLTNKIVGQVRTK